MTRKYHAYCKVCKHHTPAYLLPVGSGIFAICTAPSERTGLPLTRSLRGKMTTRVCKGFARKDQ